MSDLASHLDSIRTRLVEPAIFAMVHPLHAAAFQCANPVPYQEALRASYQPIEPGWRWGPVWSNAWFRLSGVVPAEIAAGEVLLRFSSGTESLLWNNAEPRRGLDLNHELVRLDEVRAGESIVLCVEAACNRPLGATTFFWDDAAEVARWNEHLPGRFECAELVTVHAEVQRLARVMRFVSGLIRLDGTAEEDAVRGVCDGLESLSIPEIAGGAANGLLGLFARRGPSLLRGEDAASSGTLVGSSGTRGASSGMTRCVAVGHAHIDTAWLWPVRETRRKLLRTWSTALDLLDRFPKFRFAATSAQHYAWVEEDSPPLFARVRDAIARGRWEAAGAMWVEPDANLPCGESLIRQIIHGTRYFREKFGQLGGDHGEQRTLFLPDTFGFPASLPQIMAQCGITTFIFNKLSWNDTNEFQFSTFMWQGIDGTRILSHCTPGLEYNATNTPVELRKGDANHARKSPASDLWLQPFGYGDGGGGPTEEMIESIALADRCEGMPRVVHRTIGEFCRELHTGDGRTRRAANAVDSLPTHSGELYLERHRGTYTTHARIKQANRRAEDLLRLAEILLSVAPRLPSPNRRDRSRADLDAAWKLALLNQFHDILPGSSIAAVYADSEAQYARVGELCGGVIAHALEHWPRDAVMNPASSPRRAVVSVGGDLRYFASLAPLSATPLFAGIPAAPLPVRVADTELSNGVIRAAISPSGRVNIALLDRAGRDQAFFSGLNALVLYDDAPKRWEAWDIEESYRETASAVVTPLDFIRVVQRHPLRASIELSRAIGERSRLTQRFTLDAMSPRLDITTRIDWRESRKLLRVLFPTDIKSREATYDIQFGHVARPTHAEDSFARAMFEVCAHRWMDLSESRAPSPRGLAVLNDCKYGCSCRDGVLGLSLLRSTKFPDETADMGEHEFTYSIMPHAGDWRAAGVDEEAEALNRPPVVLDAISASDRHGVGFITGEQGHSGRAGTPAPLVPKRTLGATEVEGAIADRNAKGDGAEPRDPAAWSPLTLTLDNPSARLEIAALKPAEDGDGIILRIAETRGLATAARIKWHLPTREVTPIDLLERPRTRENFVHDAAKSESRLGVGPFEIVTLRCRG